MRLLIFLGIISQLTISSANANEQFVQSGSDSKRTKPYPRISFNTHVVRTESSWQSNKLTTKLYQLSLPTAEEKKFFPHGEFQLSNFSIVGMSRNDVHKQLRSFSIDTTSDGNRNQQSIEHYAASPPGICASAGSSVLQLKYVDDHVSAYRFCSSVLH